MINARTSLGRSLRRLRVLRGIKQSHLAELMDVNQATVSRWERGDLGLSPNQSRRLARLLAERPDPGQDAILKRLILTSSAKVHLICDRSHRLLAASPARHAEWRLAPEDYLGMSLIVFASDEILQAEAALADYGWEGGEIASLDFETGANRDPDFRILPGRILWERLTLSDGTAGRLVTTIA
jgi:transcriptional regulator with XRE-family HTH domain